jgi:phthalate 4,5-dioxygenase
MLTEEENELVTRVGPGTPMGALMREYWLPAMLSSELPAPDCDPVRVMLLGEALIGFRDSSGRPGLIANQCPHRGASLWLGRNEENGLRCVYHGWKFDVEGRCVDMPNEPASSNFRNRVRAVTYPCQERAGIVWAYMGPRETPPPMPGLEATELAEGSYEPYAVLRECNWLQGIEGDLDTSHLGFLHFGSVKPEDTKPGSFEFYTVNDRAPRYAALDTDYGSMYGAYRPAGAGELYWRIAQYLFPCYAHIPTGVLGEQVRTRAWVPMDDGHTMFYEVTKVEPGVPSFGNVPTHENTTDWFGRFRPIQDSTNDYQIDRELQRTKDFTGIRGIHVQDKAITESMGPVLDRVNEHLGTSDVMVIRIRQRMAAAALALVEDKVPAPGVDTPDVFRVRSGGVILPEEANWLEATRELINH